LSSSRLGLGASYGLTAADVEYAYDRGVRYFYWGALPRPAFGRGLARLVAKHRDDIVIVMQCARPVPVMRPKLDYELRRLGVDCADFILLGWRDTEPSARIRGIVERMKSDGKIEHVMVSSHNRPLFGTFIDDPLFDAIMTRYNAAHPGAEREVFPHLPDDRKARPGVIGYTATRWGALIDPQHTPEGERTPRASDCYRFALSHDAVDVVLTGPKNRAELDEALSILQAPALTEEEQAWLRRVGTHVHDTLPRMSGPAQSWGRFAEAFLRS